MPRLSTTAALRSRAQALRRGAGELRQGARAQARLCRSLQQPRQCAQGAQALRRGAGELRQGDRPQARLCRGLQQPRQCAAGTQASRRGAGELRPGDRAQARLCRAFNNRGIALNDLKRFDDALASYDKAVALKPDYAEAFNNRGSALNELKRLRRGAGELRQGDRSQAGLCRSLQQPRQCAQELKRFDEALASYDKAIALKPDYAEAFNNRGNVLKELKRLMMR